MISIFTEISVTVFTYEVHQTLCPRGKLSIDPSLRLRFQSSSYGQYIE